MFDNIAAAASSGGGGGGGFFSIAAIIGLWKMFDKAGEDSWKAIIPIYNIYTLCNTVTGSSSLFFKAVIGAFVPVVGWAYSLYCAYKIAEATAQAYGKPDSWKWGYLFLGPVFYCITGFDSSEYYGPMGLDDHRTRDARQSKTVDFDVIRNDQAEDEDPYRGYTEYRAQGAPQQADSVQGSSAEEEETVEFIFDQPVE